MSFSDFNDFNDVNAAGCGCGCNRNNGTVQGVQGTLGNELRDECVISLKVYDFFRAQDCLRPEDIGPARAARDSCCGCIEYEAGEIIRPPSNATNVIIEKLRVKKVTILQKEEDAFREGFWNVDLSFLIVYKVVFRCSCGTECSVWAKSTFTKTVSLFGSQSKDITLSTDLFNNDGDSADMDAEPFVLVESKGVALKAEICSNRCCCCDDDRISPTGVDEDGEVLVTIGLFSIVKLFRLVQLVLPSKGFCIPQQSAVNSVTDPCEFFATLDFPLDIFAPPQRREFLAGVSANIPAEVSPETTTKTRCVCECEEVEAIVENPCNRNNSCGCGCNKKKFR